MRTLAAASAGCNHAIEDSHRCAGIDFSPASIRHARETAAADGQSSCTYREADLRDGSFGQGFDLAMMVFGQFNVFPRDRGSEILRSAHVALKPGGVLLLEVQGREQIRREAQDGPSWYTARSGLFSASPHLVLQESFWHEDAGASTIRFVVIDAETASVQRYALSNEAYTKAELGDALSAAGFEDLEWFPSLSGESEAGKQDLPVVVART